MSRPLTTVLTTALAGVAFLALTGAVSSAPAAKGRAPAAAPGRTAATFMTAIRNGLMTWPSSGVKTEKDVKVEHLMGCAKCHLPQLADATDNVAQEIVTTIPEGQGGG